MPVIIMSGSQDPHIKPEKIVPESADPREEYLRKTFFRKPYVRMVAIEKVRPPWRAFLQAGVGRQNSALPSERFTRKNRNRSEKNFMKIKFLNKKKIAAMEKIK